MDKILTDKHTHALSFSDSDVMLQQEHLSLNFNLGVTGGSFEKNVCISNSNVSQGFVDCCFWEQYEGGAQQSFLLQRERQTHRVD